MKFLFSIFTFPYRVFRWMMITRPIRFTRFGTLYVVFCVGVGAAAINTGNNLLYLILGILLGFILLSGFLSDGSLWGIRTEWSAAGSFYAGVPGGLWCRVQKGWFPALMLTIEADRNEEPPLLSRVPWISSRGSTSFQVPVTWTRRGVAEIRSCRYSTQFPFGLFQKSHREEIKARWVVYPRLLSLPAHFSDFLGGDQAQAPAQHAGMGSIPLLLRDFRYGDALRRVDWKISAKRGRLMVKEMEADRGIGNHLYLEAWPEDFSNQAMEEFISFIAALVYQSHKQARPVALHMPDQHFPPDLSRSNLHRVFQYLALVEPFAARAGRPRRRLETRSMSGTNILSLWSLYVAKR